MRLFIPAYCVAATLSFQQNLARADGLRDISASRQQWQEINRSHNLSYSFDVVSKSWTGMGQNTVIDVEADQVVRRSFSRWLWYYDHADNNTYKEELIESWIEDQDMIGTHEAGEPAKTFDQVYAECEENILARDPDRYEIDFSTDHRGLLRTCRARDIYCADDCWEGIEIKSLIIHDKAR